ncbi:zinc finger protein 501-like [Culex pipiens pallens]|uniref:zinc finger protein 501-like n=1 Tax=Culex pipiens pallens TaxID=42434 RepID=UPI001952F8D4|nr:zinc finger protein 501-like [Culex pipiens pallens]
MSTENLAPDEIQRLCRLCLTDDDLQCALFGADSNSNLAQKILECTSIQIENIPGVPGFLCEVCKSKLVICSQFISQCLKTDEKIRRIYAKQFEQFAKSHVEIVSKESSQIEILDYFVEDPASSEADGKQGFLIEVIEEAEELEESQNDQKVTEIELSLDESSGQLVNLEQEANDPSWEPQVMNKINSAEIELSEAPSEKDCAKKVQEESFSEQDKTSTPNNKSKHRLKGKCTICGVPQQNMKQHMAVHTGIKKHICQFCNKAFAQRGNLTIHLNIHTGNKPHKCDQCTKSFGDPTALKLHKVNHTSELKYHCTICGCNFKYPHSLKSHIRSHNNERNHACSYCDKAFITANVLKRHIRTHTGERPYRCDLCARTFASDWNLATHKKSHHDIQVTRCSSSSGRRPSSSAARSKPNGPPFGCDLCKSSFRLKANLKKHKAIHEKQKRLAAEK